MSDNKSIQDLLLAGDDSSDEESAVLLKLDDEGEACPRCGVENDDEAKVCWSCGSPMVLPTLAEQGRYLPIGIVGGDKESGVTLNKRFEIIPLTPPIDRAIGRYWNKKRESLTLAEYVGVILAFTVSHVGETDMTKMKVPERLNFFNTMFMGDVFYIYAFLRLHSMGKELMIKGLRCVDPECGHRFNYNADVSSLGIVTLDVDTLEHKVKLQDGFDLAGEVRDTLILRPPLWGTMGNPNFSKSQQDTFEITLLSCIVEIEGLPRGTALQQMHFDGWSKSDVELVKELSDPVVAAGPRWTVEGICPNCGEMFFFELDWTYDNFFGRSFVSRRRGRRSKK